MKPSRPSRSTKPTTGPRPHEKDRELYLVAERLQRQWTGPGQVPTATELQALCSLGFDLLWDTAQQIADATTVVRAISLRGELHISATKGRQSLSLNIQEILACLITTLRTMPHPNELPAHWTESLTHNAHCLTQTVDLMHNTGMDQHEAYRHVLDLQVLQGPYTHINVRQHDGTFQQHLTYAAHQN